MDNRLEKMKVRVLKTSVFLNTPPFPLPPLPFRVGVGGRVLNVVRAEKVSGKVERKIGRKKRKI